jgi:hypothetical protein
LYSTLRPRVRPFGHTPSGLIWLWRGVSAHPGGVWMERATQRQRNLPELGEKAEEFGIVE